MTEARRERANGCPVEAGNGRQVTVDFARTRAPLARFWSGSGHALPLERPDTRQNMQHIGAVPNDGCVWQRTHNLLEAVSAGGLGSGAHSYDWSVLDSYLDLLVGSGQRPLFELMGYPRGIASFFEQQWDRPHVREAWITLVRDLALHLEARFGRETARGWYFESWNEPDGLLTGDWGTPPWASFEQFLHYYDACVEGLRSADPLLRFGGPGSGMNFCDLFRDLVRHCAEGRNRVTGETGSRMDFMSFHLKDCPRLQVSIARDAIRWARRTFPERFGRTLFWNNEHDRAWDWKRHFVWRGSPWYAGYLARAIAESQDVILAGEDAPYRFNNDSAFIGEGTFAQRTHLVRFGDGERFALIKKPMHNVFTALSFLGSEQCVTSGLPAGGDFGILATRGGTDRVAVLAYHAPEGFDLVNCPEEFDVRYPPARLRLRLDAIPFAAGRMSEFRLDTRTADARDLWRAMGRPESPTFEQVESLRGGHELTRTRREDARCDGLTLDLELPVGIVVVTIERDRGSVPPAVSNLADVAYSGAFAGREDIMLTWSCPANGPMGYEVRASRNADGPFERLTGGDLFCRSFVHSRQAGEKTWYEVRAIDSWNRAGVAERLCV